MRVRRRESAAERFDVSAVAAAHERAYREVMARGDRGRDDDAGAPLR